MAIVSKKRPAPNKVTSSNGAKLVKDLADILGDADLVELEYATEEVTIRLSRVGGASPIATFQPSTTAAMMPAAAQPAAMAPENPADHPGAIISPMVGTVYTSPEPNAQAFIAEGDSVSVGQTLLIVEAMKVMNPITSTKAGKVVKIFVCDAQPVEFGEVLVIVE